MDKLQKRLQKIGIEFKQKHGLPKNEMLWVEFLDEKGKCLVAFIGGPAGIYCRAAYETAHKLSISVYNDWGRAGYGPNRDTKQLIDLQDSETQMAIKKHIDKWEKYRLEKYGC